MKKTVSKQPQRPALRTDKHQEQPRGLNPWVYVVVALVICLGIFAVVQWPVWSATIFATPQQNAWTACTMFVQNQVGISANAAESFNPAKVKPLTQSDYQVDVYYTKMNITYSCATQLLPDGKWQLTSLKAVK